MKSSDASITCPNCGAPLETPVGCLQCHAIFPPAAPIDHFERLALPVTFAINDADLERNFLTWSRELHPDYFQLAPDDIRELSSSLQASLNEAYAVLKDPIRRAEYFVSLFGGPSASEHRDMPTGFLEEVLELRMEIAEAKESGSAEAAESKALAEKLAKDRAAVLETIGKLFEKTHPLDAQALVSIRQQLNTIKYFDGLLRELNP